MADTLAVHSGHHARDLAGDRRLTMRPEDRASLIIFILGMCAVAAVAIYGGMLQ